jgi:hypothetical protein
MSCGVKSAALAGAQRIPAATAKAAQPDKIAIRTWWDFSGIFGSIEFGRRANLNATQYLHIALPAEQIA